jgi:hypothetical protein
MSPAASLAGANEVVVSHGRLLITPQATVPKQENSGGGPDNDL